MLNFKTAKQHVAEQSEDKEFVAELEQARIETELVVTRSPHSIAIVPAPRSSPDSRAAKDVTK